MVGGIALGIGYISPVSTLIRGFPDRRGLASGLAIMGFGGGAMIGVLMADRLMKHFAVPSSADAARVAAVAAWFTGVLSLFNILGRFFWSKLSDRIGRPALYTIFFAAGVFL